MALKLWASSTANALKPSCSGSRAPFPSISRCFSSVLDGLKYSKSHEWVKHEGSVATIGITDHAQIACRVQGELARIQRLLDASRRRTALGVLERGARTWSSHIRDIMYGNICNDPLRVKAESRFKNGASATNRPALLNEMTHLRQRNKDLDLQEFRLRLSKARPEYRSTEANHR